jgi:hypothetical protein
MSVTHLVKLEYFQQAVGRKSQASSAKASLRQRKYWGRPENKV